MPILVRTALATTLFVALGAQAPSPEAPPQTIEIQLTNFRFTPKTIELRRGEPVQLHFVNAGSGGHNFSAPAFFDSASIDPEDAKGLVDGKVELKKGETRDVRLVPLRAGTYKVRCTHFLHSGFGMKGEIVVNEP